MTSIKRIIKKSILFIFIIVLACSCQSVKKPSLYEMAMADAMVATVDEIYPLVCLTPESDMATFDEEGRVLLLSFHDSENLFVEGSSLKIESEIWTFTDKEILAWYGENHMGVKDWKLRFNQLLGLPIDSDYTHVSAFWVNVDDVIRPCFQTDVTKNLEPDMLDGSLLGEYASWFNENEEYSYSEETPYPWTRLGYTYDWSGKPEAYGLTEFLILPNADIEVCWTKTTNEFLNYLEWNNPNLKWSFSFSFGWSLEPEFSI